MIETLWLVFRLGQLGVMLEHDPTLALEVVDEITAKDVPDLRVAVDGFENIVRDMLANARRNAIAKKEKD